MAELLVFSIQLPQYGYSATVDLVKAMPLEKRVKDLFLTKMVEIRNIVAVDVKLTKDEPLSEQVKEETTEATD